MKLLFRILGLVMLFGLSNFAIVKAQIEPEYGSCYIDCGESQLYEISYTTYRECCQQIHQCPNGYGFFTGYYWNGYYQSGPRLCE
jgi:hypothetical protein